MDDIQSIQAGSGLGDVQGSSTSKTSSALIKSQDTTLAVIEAATASLGNSHSDRMTLVLQKTSEWLEQRIEEWTVLPQEAVKKQEDPDCDLATERPQAESRTGPHTTSTSGVEEPKPAALPESQQRVEALEARTRLTEQGLEREREPTSQMRRKLA
jgi:hypothetical protein